MYTRVDSSIDHIVQRVRRLRMAAGVLHVGAHPDDEDIGMLSYLSHKYGVRAVYWSATRGEGGQNRIGSYSGETLGVYRTWEADLARQEDGSESYYGPFLDFGYAKNASDAFAKWGKENVVRHIVRAIRLLKPEIVVARWRGESGDLHGHHQAVGLATLEAFDAAGDPEKYSELEEQGLSAWQPHKLYHSTDNTGGDYSVGAALNLFGVQNPDLEKDGILRIDTGEYDPTTGKTYQERAWLAYNRHQTQAMGLAPKHGDFYYYFSLHKSHVEVPPRESSFFDGFNPTLVGLADRFGDSAGELKTELAKVTEIVERTLERLRAEDPYDVSNYLMEGLPCLKDAIELVEQAEVDSAAKKAVNTYLKEKYLDFEEVIALCLNLQLEGLSTESRVTPGQSFKVDFFLWNNRGAGISDVKLSLDLPEGWETRVIEETREDEHALARYDVTTSKMALFSCPYWLFKPRSEYKYVWPSGEPAGRPFAPPDVHAICSLKVGTQRINLRIPVMCRKGFPGGYQELPVMVIPPIALQPKSTRLFCQVSEKAQHAEIQVTGRNNTIGAVKGSMSLDLPEGWQSDPESIDLFLPETGDSYTGTFQVTIPANTPEKTYAIRCIVHSGGREYSYSITPVRMGMPGLPGEPTASNCIKEANIVSPAEIKIFLIQVELAKKQSYAYVPGVKENIRDALLPFGISFTELSPTDMAYEDLSKYDVIVIGPNAYLLSEDLRNNAQRFLDYIKDGGTLIVQYQGYGFQGKGFTPYDFRYNQPHDRVTFEDAEITILNPSHPVFHFPNLIEKNDFENWVSDRGMYFFGEWDKRYKPLMACHDPGEESKEGGYLVCQYGRGSFVYTGYSFFKQLPAGISGPFRLFGNLLALPAARINERKIFLRCVDLFTELDDEYLESVARIMERRWVGDGTMICREGEEGNELYFIQAGEIDVIKTKDEKEEIIAVVDANSCVGEMSILGNIPRFASLRAKGDVDLLVIKGEDFENILNENPRIAIKLLGLLVKRLAVS